MPVTSLWRIKGDVAAVIDYTTDERKTQWAIEHLDVTAEELKMPLDAARDRRVVAEAMEAPAGEDGEFAVSDLSAVADYATRGNATVWRDSRGEKHRLVSGVNCCPDTAVDEMRRIKKRWGKMGGTVAYHGYQSFADGEGPPDLIHQIGVETAKRLWGDRYQVLVTTHVDKEHHYHNHFVINTVSFVDGKKFYRSAKDYHDFRQVSDELAREHGFYVIEDPARGRKRDYAPGKPNWHKIVRADVDEAILKAGTEEHFFSILRARGYALKTGAKGIAAKAPGAERFFWLERNFGPEYSRAALRQRIAATWEQGQVPRGLPGLRQTGAETLTGNSSVGKERRWAAPVARSGSFLPGMKRDRPVLYVPYRGGSARRPTRKKLRGFQALYIRYCFMLGAIPAKRPRPVTKVSPALKKDLLKLDQITAQTRLLCGNHIETAGQLAAHKAGLQGQLAVLTTERQGLYRQQRRANVKGDPSRYQANKARMSEISAQCYRLRKEIKLCDGIHERSPEVKAKVRTEQIRQQHQQQAGKRKNRWIGKF